MALPPKSYYHLKEIAERWGVTADDLACYALDGLLEIAVMTTGARVETGSVEKVGEDLLRVIHAQTVLYGPQPVIASDLWPVFRRGSARLRRFKPPSADSFMDLREGADPLAVTLGDLLVTREELQRFEAEHGLITAAEPSPAADQSPTAFIHRNDYSEVVLNGEIFRLGPLQASIVRLLHEASLTQKPWRLGKELLTECGASSIRMLDLFKAKQNWRNLIASDGRGSYRLNLQDRPSARPSHRAYRRFPGGLLFRAAG